LILEQVFSPLRGAGDHTMWLYHVEQIFHYWPTPMVLRWVNTQPVTNVGTICSNHNRLIQELLEKKAKWLLKKINNFRRAGYYNIEVNKILDKERL
jgi:hypothetical protein